MENDQNSTLEDSMILDCKLSAMDDHISCKKRNFENCMPNSSREVNNPRLIGLAPRAPGCANAPLNQSTPMCSSCVNDSFNGERISNNISNISNDACFRNSTMCRKITLICGFGGKILPRPIDGRLRYVGGCVRIITITSNVTFPEFMQKMILVYGQQGQPIIKYQLPGEELDALVSVSGAHDLENLIEEYHRLVEYSDGKSTKIRVFLFSPFERAHESFMNLDGTQDLQKLYIEAINEIYCAEKVARKEDIINLTSNLESYGQNCNMEETHVTIQDNADHTNNFVYSRVDSSSFDTKLLEPFISNSLSKVELVESSVNISNCSACPILPPSSSSLLSPLLPSFSSLVSSLVPVGHPCVIDEEHQKFFAYPTSSINGQQLVDSSKNAMYLPTSINGQHLGNVHKDVMHPPASITGKDYVNWSKDVMYLPTSSNAQDFINAPNDARYTSTSIHFQDFVKTSQGTAYLPISINVPDLESAPKDVRYPPTSMPGMNLVNVPRDAIYPITSINAQDFIHVSKDSGYSPSFINLLESVNAPKNSGCLPTSVNVQDFDNETKDFIQPPTSLTVKGFDNMPKDDIYPPRSRNVADCNIVPKDARNSTTSTHLQDFVCTPTNDAYIPMSLNVQDFVNVPKDMTYSPLITGKDFVNLQKEAMYLPTSINAQDFINPPKGTGYLPTSLHLRDFVNKSKDVAYNLPVPINLQIFDNASKDLAYSPTSINGMDVNVPHNIMHPTTSINAPVTAEYPPTSMLVHDCVNKPKVTTELVHPLFPDSQPQNLGITSSGRNNHLQNVNCSVVTDSIPVTTATNLSSACASPRVGAININEGSQLTPAIFDPYSRRVFLGARMVPLVYGNNDTKSSMSIPHLSIGGQAMEQNCLRQVLLNENLIVRQDKSSENVLRSEDNCTSQKASPPTHSDIFLQAYQNEKMNAIFEKNEDSLRPFTPHGIASAPLSDNGNGLMIGYKFEHTPDTKDLKFPLHNQSNLNNPISHETQQPPQFRSPIFSQNPETHQNISPMAVNNVEQSGYFSKSLPQIVMKTRGDDLQPSCSQFFGPVPYYCHMNSQYMPSVLCQYQFKQFVVGKNTPGYDVPPTVLPPSISKPLVSVYEDKYPRQSHVFSSLEASDSCISNDYVRTDHPGHDMNLANTNEDLSGKSIQQPNSIISMNAAPEYEPLNPGVETAGPFPVQDNTIQEFIPCNRDHGMGNDILNSNVNLNSIFPMEQYSTDIESLQSTSLTVNPFTDVQQGMLPLRVTQSGNIEEYQTVKVSCVQISGSHFEQMPNRKVDNEPLRSHPMKINDSDSCKDNLSSNFNVISESVVENRHPTPSNTLFSNFDHWDIQSDKNLQFLGSGKVNDTEGFLKENSNEVHISGNGRTDASDQFDKTHILDALGKDFLLGSAQALKEEEITQKEKEVANPESLAELPVQTSIHLDPIFTLKEKNEKRIAEFNSSNRLIEIHNYETEEQSNVVNFNTEEMKNIVLHPSKVIPVTDAMDNLQIIKNSDLEEIRELGSGTFGTVYHGKWRGSDVAIKRIHDRHFYGKSLEQERLRDEFWSEAARLGGLHHPNVVAFYGVVLDGPGGSVATVTEFMVDGSLRQALHSNGRIFDRHKRLLIAMDIAFGMEYLHGKNIVHFDLKSDNLLVNLKDPQRPICKVSDLGLSKVKCKTLISGGVRGTLSWMAPELLNGSSSLVSEKVDVYSFGIVMWELLTGEEPYADLHYGAIIGGIVNNTLRPSIPQSCETDWRVLMERCWSSEPSERPSFTEIASQLRHMAASQPQ